MRINLGELSKKKLRLEIYSLNFWREIFKFIYRYFFLNKAKVISEKYLVKNEYKKDVRRVLVN